jgi:hypothetical protein
MRRFAGGDVAAGWREIIDRLADLGEPLGPGTTPAELAATVDPALRPLAEVYGEATYGPAGRVAPARTALAAQSLEAAEDHMGDRYPLRRRIRSRYRLTSLLPARWWSRRHA